MNVIKLKQIISNFTNLILSNSKPQDFKNVFELEDYKTSLTENGYTLSNNEYSIDFKKITKSDFSIYKIVITHEDYAIIMFIDDSLRTYNFNYMSTGSNYNFTIMYPENIITNEMVTSDILSEEERTIVEINLPNFIRIDYD